MSVNIENINQNDFQDICRTCLNNCDVKFFGDYVILNVFYKLTDIQFKTNDNLPQQVCLECFEKINEIQEFASRCKRSHAALLKRLNKSRTSQLNEEQDNIENSNEKETFTVVIKSGEDIAINTENTIVKDENLNSTNDDVKDESKTSENDLEITLYELNGNIIQETSEINGAEQKQCFKDDCKINENDDVLNSDVNWSDLSEETSSSDSSPSLMSRSVKNSKKASTKLKFKYEDGRKRKPSSMCLYKCKQCQKSFYQMGLLKKHLRIHSDERPYKCDQCSKPFKHSHNLKAHMRTHSDERSYKCNQCLNTFKFSSNLKRHMLIHSGERPYKCQQCSESFTQINNLKAHMRVHGSECPYKCNQCSNSFKYLKSLKIHMRLHNGERPYQCEQCLKSFRQLHHLQYHMTTHGGEQPDKCESSESIDQLIISTTN